MYAYLARFNREVARRTRDELLETVERIARGELQGPMVQLVDGGLVQRWTHPPYRIYYRLTARRVTIVSIYHGARRPIEE
jgi:plasmid stabilization system protein ParE